jgi:hypothetical protein
MVNVGASEFVLGVALAVIAGAALVAVLVLLAVTALSSVTVGLTPLMAALQRKRLREWHPPTSWMPEETEAPRPTCRHRAGFHVTGVVSDQDAGVQARLLTAEAAPEDDGNQGGGRDGSCARVTMVHARLEPTTRFELPSHHRDKVVVCVVAGDGYVGTAQRPVSAGDIAVLDAGAELCVEAGSDLLSGPLEVFILGETPGHPTVATRPQDRPARSRHRFSVAVMRGRGWTGRAPGLPQAIPRHPRHAARVAARLRLPSQRPEPVGAPRGSARIAQSHGLPLA